jgi:hypothetical protein
MDIRIQRRASLINKELEGIIGMKGMIQEYLGTGGGSEAVREFLVKAGEDDELLLRFLKGRKYKTKHAWETLKRNGEVRFDDYPEVFPQAFPKAALTLLDNHIAGVLKGRDSKGRRVIYFNGNEWDTEKHSLELVTTFCAFSAERMLLDEDCMNNGLVIVKECSSIGWKQAKEYTLASMLRLMNVFLFAYPLKVKAMYYVNVPYFLTFIYGIIKPFLPKKFKERFVLTSTSKKFEDLHKHLSPEILPKCLGGKLEAHEAVDRDLLNFH